MEKLKASGADVLALFVSPALAGRALGEAAALAWKPALLVAADSSSAVSGGVVAEAYSIGFLKDPTDPRWLTDPAMRLYRTILAR